MFKVSQDEGERKPNDENSARGTLGQDNEGSSVKDSQHESELYSKCD